MPADRPVEWRHARGALSLESPVLMGILNVTPGSFSDGGTATWGSSKREFAVTSAIIGVPSLAITLKIIGCLSPPEAMADITDSTAIGFQSTSMNSRMLRPRTSSKE